MRNLVIYLNWLAGQSGVSVETWSKQTLGVSRHPTTNKLTFYVSEEWAFSNDPATIELLEGGFYHEALGHARHTTFDDFTELETKDFKWTPFSRGIRNILEDIFIEKQAMKIYPTVQPALARTVEILTEREFFGSPATFQQDPMCLVHNALLNYCRGRLLPDQGKYLQANMAALDQIVPSVFGNLWPAIWDIAKESANAKSSRDNAALTRDIMLLLQAVSQGEQPQSQKGEGQPNQTQSGDGEGDDGSDQTADNQGQGNDDSNAAESQFGEKESDVAKQILANQNGAQPSTEMTDIVAKAVKEAIEKSGGGGAGGGKLKVVAPNFHPQPSQVERIARIVKHRSDDLIEILTNESYAKRELVKIGTRIDRRSLVPGACGFTDRIFECETRGQGLSTAVTILTDYSGSMDDKGAIQDDVGGGSGITPKVVAEGVMYGLGAIFDEFEIPYEFAAFSDAYMTAKSFDDDGEMIRKRRQSPLVNGGTITGAACQMALSRLVCRTEEKKLLIIITDGDTSDLDMLASCYNEAKHMGIEVASVMIGNMISSIKQLSVFAPVEY